MPPEPAPPPSALPQVLCFGEALVDRLFLPGVDPTGVDAPGGNPLFDDHLGGAPANVACGLARLGTPVAFLGRLGEDPIGHSFHSLFSERGVDTSALQRDTQRPSRIVLVRRDSDGERSFGGFAGGEAQGFADEVVDADELVRGAKPLLTAARWLLVGTIPLASPPSAAALWRLVELAEERGVPLAVDVNWRPTFWGYGPRDGPPLQVRQRIRPLLERAALIKCAAEEAEWLFEEADPCAIHAALPQRPAVLITDGARPLRWCLGEGSGSLRAFRLPVVDTTGAGDAFTAGLLHGLCSRPELLGSGGSKGPRGASGSREADAAPAEGPERLIRFASACGALVCQGAGAIEPQPTRAEVEGFLNQSAPVAGDRSG